MEVHGGSSGARFGTTGDVVTVKGSLGSRMAPITAALAALDETKGTADAV